MKRTQLDHANCNYRDILPFITVNILQHTHRDNTVMLIKLLAFVVVAAG